MPAAPPKPRKIGSRACDACKIRKVKCTEIPPCRRCSTIGIECTFNKGQATRGPRSLRAKTWQQIRDAQQQQQQQYQEKAPEDAAATRDGSADGSPLSSTGRDPLMNNSTTPVIAVEWLVLRLCIYRLRLFPVWPIVAVEEVIASLQRDAEDQEMYALATAIGAATMAQLKLDRSRDCGINDAVTAHVLEAECQRSRVLLDSQPANLNKLRTSFFLHIFHENQQPGGTKSLLYLREAITLAQIIGLHRATSYAVLPSAEQRIRRRTIWLLFVTERGVSMLHKLPVVLDSNGKLPPLDSGDADDEAHILPAFKKLVNLFWIFDQSGAFEILQDSADGAEGAGARNFDVLSTLQRRLQEDALDLEQGGNDVQKADILATRQWMQILIWRANTGRRANAAAIAVHGPIQIATEFLDLAARLPSAALEAHGPGIEFKVFEIASAVADVIASHLSQSNALPMDVRPSDILARLQTLLASTRGGNNSLLRLLGARIAQAEAQPAAHFSLGPSMVPHQRVDEILDGGISSWNQANGNPEQTFDVQAYHDQAAMTQMQPLGWPFPASPWLSLVAAAELEQQQHADGTRGQQMQGEAEGMSPGTGGWFSQSLDLLAQLESEPPTSEASMESLPGNNSVDMMTGDPWLLDLGQS
ncbi:hypothetical protein D7B24_001683 [Verticillium nonalfalfae]|uniref:Zn(2)-C6 fungal-type domain-containing protein n=1 Tax=Verticillium nonalfalfae TaxID=1051616 RepID=A0A3M9Y316_9PEZI|nr:uncharacterized protein D7B24_001683 [Verticillium nonalfalfae]RNJ53530.1 hypothetical protein D7B24_001683 [Verticillium nonalfalfae]